MESAKKARGGSWTEAEKISVLWQIIVLQGGSIPWAKLTLPEGRTLKAAQVMLDRERQRIKQQMASNSTAEGSGDGNEDDATEGPRKIPAGTKKKAPSKSKLKSTVQKRTLSEAALDSDVDDEQGFHVPKSTTSHSKKKAKSRADTPAAIKTEQDLEDLLA